jgi:uncharacterized membrane protein
VSGYHWLLTVHILGAFALIAGAVVAGTAQIAALQRDRPSEVASLLRTSRTGAALVGVGSLVVLVFGIWLASYQRYGIGDEWVVASIVLWVLSMALGGIGGRSARHARERAESLAAAGDEPDEELRALVSHRPSLILSYLSTALLVAILVLMVWKPGASSPAAVKRPSDWNWLLFAHLVGAFAFAGGIVAATIAAFAADGRPPDQARLLARAARRTRLLVTWPGLVLVVAAGFALANKEDVFSSRWVQLGMALTVVAAVLDIAESASAGSRAENPVRRPLVALLGPIAVASVAVVFFLMAAKP